MRLVGGKQNIGIFKENQIEKRNRKFDDFRNEIKKDMKDSLTQMVFNQSKGKR